MSQDFATIRRSLELLQTQRLRRDFADLMVEPQYQALGEFFFNELYAPRDFSERNASAHRLYQMLKTVPGVRIAQIERAVRLMDLTDDLDVEVAMLLLEAKVPLPISEQIYELAYLHADAYDRREEQLGLIIDNVRDAHSLARVPLMIWHMRQIQGLADSLGFGSLARFLVKSLEAVKPVRDLDRFTTTLYTREKQRLDRIYGR